MRTSRHRSRHLEEAVARGGVHAPHGIDLLAWSGDHFIMIVPSSDAQWHEILDRWTREPGVTVVIGRWPVVLRRIEAVGVDVDAAAERRRLVGADIGHHELLMMRADQSGLAVENGERTGAERVDV